MTEQGPGKTKEPSPSEKIKEKLNALYLINDFERMTEFQTEIANRAKYLKQKYPDHVKRRVMHTLSGSGFFQDESDIIEEDFSGDDSVEKFIDYLTKKYL